MRIDYLQCCFSLESKDVILLPSYKGSTLRGGFGNAFRRVVCALRKTDCSDCILKEKCVYSYVFETPPPSDTTMMRKYSAAPHPFIIEPPPERKHAYKLGDTITFGLTVIGRAVDYLPYFIYTFEELGKTGIGKGRGKYELKQVSVQKSEGGIEEAGVIYLSDTKTLRPVKAARLNLESTVFNPEALGDGALSLSFLTPTRLIYDGHLADDLEFHVLIRQLLRRISLIHYFHCGGEPSLWDFKGIIEKAKEVESVKSGLKWYDWERYSARQDAKVKMGGFVGEIKFAGDIGPFMPLINAGEILHVGKGTAFGLGRYKIQDSKFKIQD